MRLLAYNLRYAISNLYSYFQHGNVLDQPFPFLAGPVDYIFIILKTLLVINQN